MFKLQQKHGIHEEYFPSVGLKRKKDGKDQRLFFKKIFFFFVWVLGTFFFFFGHLVFFFLFVVVVDVCVCFSESVNANELAVTNTEEWIN